MLSNAYFLAKFRFDTAENEPAKNLQKFANFADPNPLITSLHAASCVGSSSFSRGAASASSGMDPGSSTGAAGGGALKASFAYE